MCTNVRERRRIQTEGNKENEEKVGEQEETERTEGMNI
jgi:hypothetical protein